MSEFEREAQVASRTDTKVPAYEPPAIAWEEDFEPLSAASAGSAGRYGPNAVNQLMGCDQVG